MVRIHPDPPSGHRTFARVETVQRSTVGHGGVAQLGERLLCKQEVIGSIPFTSTTAFTARWLGTQPGSVVTHQGSGISARSSVDA